MGLLGVLRGSRGWRGAFRGSAGEWGCGLVGMVLEMGAEVYGLGC